MVDDARDSWRRLAGIALLVLVTAGVTASAPLPVPVPLPVEARHGPYGSGIGADSLANTQVGGTSSGSPNLMTAFRFRATQSAALSSVRIYLVDGDGYAGGTGGTMSISVQTDSGTADHTPSGQVLSSTVIEPGNPIRLGNLPLVSFASAAPLVAGRLYHLVFENADPAPTENYVSINSLWTAVRTVPRQPTVADLDWAQLMDAGSGWTLRPTFTPILDLGYDTGAHAGVGYMEVWVKASRAISGADAVREIFTPRAARAASAVSVRVRRGSGSSPLIVRVVSSADGAVLAEGSIPASTFGDGARWVTANLSRALVLESGVSYQLVLSTAADSSYSTHAIERGNNYHFDPETYFADGYGQYTTGAGWSGFDQPGGSKNNTNSDLQFYFE